MAAVGLVAVPGQIVTDGQGIRQTRKFLLLPGSTRELRWEEVDSMYEEVARDHHGRSYYQLVVSAGPDKTIEFSPWHVGREEFVKAVEARGIPVVRVPKPV